jgi:hypothetical protein
LFKRRTPAWIALASAAALALSACAAGTARSTTTPMPTGPPPAAVSAALRSVVLVEGTGQFGLPPVDGFVIGSENGEAVIATTADAVSSQYFAAGPPGGKMVTAQVIGCDTAAGAIILTAPLHLPPLKIASSTPAAGTAAYVLADPNLGNATARAVARGAVLQGEIPHKDLGPGPLGAALGYTGTPYSDRWNPTPSFYSYDGAAIVTDDHGHVEVVAMAITGGFRQGLAIPATAIGQASSHSNAAQPDYRLCR